MTGAAAGHPCLGTGMAAVLRVPRQSFYSPREPDLKPRGFHIAQVLDFPVVCLARFHMAADHILADDQKLSVRLLDQRRTIEALSRIGPEGLSTERLMHHVVAQVSRVTGVERIKIMRYRADRGDLLIVAGVGWKPGVVGSATLAADYSSPAGRAFQTGAPVTIENIVESDEFHVPDLLREHDIVALVNVPIMINGQAWGILEVDSTRPYKFDQWDISFLSTVANVMGICLSQCEVKQRNAEALAEKTRQRAEFDTIVRELRHRLKNNLQMIVAFLTIKTRDLPLEVRHRLNEVIGRVQAVALAHDLLSASDKASSVNFDDYLRALCANVVPHRTGITVEVEAQRVSIPIDRAVPAGLIVNELVTNSIKHAFGKDDGGRITICFALTSNASEACILVEDTGKGMDIPPKRGLGLTLIEGIAQQIQARIDYVKVETGCKTMISFPVAT
jgi:two-component sensor histidine kinase